MSTFGLAFLSLRMAQKSANSPGRVSAERTGAGYQTALYHAAVGVAKFAPSEQE